MRKTFFALALIGASPAYAAGLDIAVAGEANGVISVELFEDIAPQHVERITELAQSGEYDGVAFHRVIDGFMAQTGDVQNGDTTDGYNPELAGFGGSEFENLPQEFSDIPFERGVVGMARGSGDVNSANSQFFITFDEAPFLNGQYTVVGKVTAGMEVLDAIKRGHPRSGAIAGDPDVMTTVTVIE